MLFSKNVILKQYSDGLLQNLLTSQFIYSAPEKRAAFKSLDLIIQTRKQKKIHYLYLWLFTKKIPYLRKFYFSWKNASPTVFLKSKVKKHSAHVKMLSTKKFEILYAILTQMISKQTNSEKKILAFAQHKVQIMILTAPLTENTFLLQMKNTYFPNIPIMFQFQFSNITTFQKIFFLRALKILSPVQKILALDSLDSLS